MVPALDSSLRIAGMSPFSLIRYGKTRLYQDEYEEGIYIYIDAIIRYVFGE
ncbi:MAG: hypothetical protein ACK5LL_05145 [Suipraeoptans sp.]